MANEKRLTVLAVKNAGPGRHADGGSLYLDVAATGSRRCLYRYRAGEKVKDMALGDATIVTLADARALRDKWRRELALGNDPTETRRVKKAAGVTFGEVADRVLESQRIKSLSNPKHRAQWSYSLTKLAAPLRSRPVADVSTQDVLAVLRPLWASGKHETASRLRSRVELVIEVSRSEGAIPDDKPNVARWRNHIELHAPRSEAVKEHHAALPYRDLPAFMAWLRAKDSVSARALEFTILTAVRTGETRFAAAAEIDFDSATWIIPAQRMKARKEHRVPLCDRALQIAKVRAESPYLFAGKRGKPLSNMAMAELLKHRAAPEIATVHGFRSTFDQWASEVAHADREVIGRKHIAERALASLALPAVVHGAMSMPQHRQALFDARPDLGTQPIYWSLPDSWSAASLRSTAEHAELVPAIIKAMVSSAKPSIREACEAFGRENVLRRLIELLNLDEVTPLCAKAWLSEACSDHDIVARYLCEGNIRRGLVLEALARAVSPDSVPNDFGDDPWLIAFRRIAESDLTVYLASFLLARAYGRKTQSAAALAQLTFDTVHMALEASALPEDAWRLLDDRLYRSYYWPNWDRCRRIRQTTVDLFVYRALDPQSFARITARDDLFASLVEIAANSFSGQRFLQSVRIGLEHNENQPERLRLVARAAW